MLKWNSFLSTINWFMHHHEKRWIYYYSFSLFSLPLAIGSISWLWDHTKWLRLFVCIILLLLFFDSIQLNHRFWGIVLNQREKNCTERSRSMHIWMHFISAVLSYGNSLPKTNEQKKNKEKILFGYHRNIETICRYTEQPKHFSVLFYLVVFQKRNRVLFSSNEIKEKHTKKKK